MGFQIEKCWYETLLYLGLHSSEMAIILISSETVKYKQEVCGPVIFELTSLYIIECTDWMQSVMLLYDDCGSVSNSSRRELMTRLEHQVARVHNFVPLSKKTPWSIIVSFSLVNGLTSIHRSVRKRTTIC